jgi:hypothetical protein
VLACVIIITQRSGWNNATELNVRYIIPPPSDCGINFYTKKWNQHTDSKLAEKSY